MIRLFLARVNSDDALCYLFSIDFFSKAVEFRSQVGAQLLRVVGAMVEDMVVVPVFCAQVVKHFRDELCGAPGIGDDICQAADKIREAQRFIDHKLLRISEIGACRPEIHRRFMHESGLMTRMLNWRGTHFIPGDCRDDIHQVIELAPAVIERSVQDSGQEDGHILELFTTMQDYDILTVVNAFLAGYFTREAGQPFRLQAILHLFDC